MPNYIYEPNKRILTPEELAYWLKNHVYCWAHWKQDGFTYKTSPAQVLAVRGEQIYIRHWSDYWCSFYDPLFQIRLGFRYMIEPACHTCCNRGWVRPNLGVNCPAGMAVALSACQTESMRTMGVGYMLPCDKCNADGSKPRQLSGFGE